ncbi:hypothetical protein FRB99_008877 [Tulasnella sp. 403]|nr:hypothetical protein FRB99_008877 [Tulasnella sp. 403]
MFSSDQWQPLIDILVRLPDVITSVTPWSTGKLVAGTVLLIPVFKLTRYFIWWYRSPLKDLRGPAAADNWIWGHLATIRVNPGAVFEEWIQQYGPTIQFRAFLQARRLLTIDPRAITYILNNNYEYPKPPRLRESLARIIGHGLFSVEGDDHRRQRRIMNPCFGPAQIRDLVPIFFEKAYRLKSVWIDAVEEKGPVVDILVGMMRATLDIIGSAGFSYEFNSLVVGEKNELVRSFMDVLAPANRPTVLDHLQLRFPFLRLIPTRRGRAARKGQEVVNRIGVQMLEDKKKAVIQAEQGGIDKERLAGRDILSMLVKANLAVDVKESDQMSDKEVITQIGTMLLAGHETSSTSLTWMLNELSKPENVRIQDQLRAELLAVENESPSMDELNALPYLDAVIRETLRFNCVVEFTTRMAGKDDVIPVSEPFVDHYGVERNEIRIAKGESILIPITTLNRHPKIWGEDGGEFKPERWLTPEKHANELPGVFAGTMTFLGGPRGCIGYRLAVMEMKALTFVLIRSFAFTPSDQTSMVEKTTGLVTRPALKQPDGSYKNSMPLRLTPVSSDHAVLSTGLDLVQARDAVEAEEALSIFPVIRQFEKIPPNPSAADFHGAYNKLLYSLFPAETAFTVVPRYIPASRESAGFIAYFEVLLEDKPVFILALKSPGDILYPSKRELADRQVRERIKDLIDDCPIAALHAVSAMGTKLCFFAKRPGHPIYPRTIASDSLYETDTAPRERWNYDILEEEGEQKFRAVVQEIKEACAVV